MNGLIRIKTRVLVQLAFITLIFYATPRVVDAKSTHEVHTVVIAGMKFVPEQLEVHAGDTIVWKNEDIVPHTATAENKSFDSKMINQEKSWRYVARKQGRISYSCTFHPTMKGILIVK